MAHPIVVGVEKLSGVIDVYLGAVKSYEWKRAGVGNVGGDRVLCQPSDHLSAVIEKQVLPTLHRDHLDAVRAFGDDVYVLRVIGIILDKNLRAAWIAPDRFDRA